MSASFVSVLLLVFIAMVQGFAPASRSAGMALRMSAEFDKVAYKVANSKLLTKTAQLGLLSKLDKSGVKLSTLAPLLKAADKAGVLSIVEGSSDKILPLVSTAVDFAPGLIPIAGTVLKAGPAPLIAVALASLTAAGSVIVLVPDDSIASIALQTLAAVPLGAIIPGSCVIGAGLLSKLK